MTLSYEDSRERDRESSRRAARILHTIRREEALDAYGGKCVVCENTHRDQLNIVPKRGFRWTERLAGRKLKTGSAKMRWLQEQGYPDQFTLVCGRAHSRRCWTRLQALQLVD